MSEIQEFLGELKAHGPLKPGEESVADLYEAWEEPLPALPGIDPRSVSSDLYGYYQRAAEEHQELVEEQRERQQELDHEFAKGQARAAGMQGGHDPQVAQEMLYRDMSSEDRLHWQKLADNDADKAHWKQELETAVALGDQEKADRARWYLREAEAEKEHLASKPFEGFEQAVAEEGNYWTNLPEKYNSYTPEHKKQYKTHLREAIELSHQSDKPYLWGYDEEKDKAVKVLTGGPPAREVYERISRHERLSEFDADVRPLEACNAGFRVPRGKLVREPEPVEEVKDSEVEPEADIEVVRVGTGGEPEVTFHDQEEPETETDRTPKPKTNIHTFM